MKRQIAHYQLVSELGRGGMGVVYKAYEPALERYVAIKELSSSLSHDPDLVQRFIREARAMAALNDPHIIQIHFIGQDGEQPYFAMEFVDGESLSSLLEREGPLKTADALKICQQAARGLACAHAQGVIHRDIKPSNLMLNKRDQLKIADFGIAFTQKDFSKKLTATGDVVGTPGYLSPEVCLGNPVDARSDLFALGIVLYEMLSGHIPFNDPSPLKLMLSVVESEVPDIRKLNQSIDTETVGILNRLLAKNPEDRYQSADQLLSAITKHPAMTDQPLSVHARLPSGAASTMLATPGLIKAAGKTDSDITSVSGSVSRANTSGKFLWPSIAAITLIVACGLFWINRPDNSDLSPKPPDSEPQVSNSVADKAAMTVELAPTSTVTTNPAMVSEKESRPENVVIEDKPPTTATKTKISLEEKPTMQIEPTAPLQNMQKYGEVFLGPQNEEVSVAEIDGEDVAYIKVTGINSPYDGKVIRTVPRPAAYDGRDYVIQYQGSDYVVLVIRKYSSREKLVELYLPGLGDEVKLSYDADLSKKLDTGSIRDEYHNQK
ncbi:MAG TPA: serine/threonine-protein kinase [Arenimonas sp.]|nr:serine/threonine-protein kinase [Arenimonas sp.]